MSFLDKYLVTDKKKSDNENTGEHPVPKNASKAATQKSVMSGMGIANLPIGVTYTPITTATPVGSAADQSIVTELNAVADSSKRPEYAAFLKAMDSLKGMPDGQRTTMALSVLQGMQGITPQAVVDAVDDRLALVDAEKSGFEASYTQAVAQSVTGVEAEVANIEAQVQAKQAEIEALQQRRVALKQEASTAQINLEASRATFLASHTVVHTSLQNERERIITNLPR
jgi:hypothetical protein